MIVPWAVLLLLATVPPDYRNFYRSATGHMVVIVGAVWSSFGLLVMRAIARDHGERRVLGGGAVASDTHGVVP